MDTFSEKELEQLKKLEQLRRLLQTILKEHVRLLVAVFVIVLIAILLSVYLKAVYSPVRFEAQAMLYYYPKQTANIRPFDPKYVLQVLTRNAMRQQFYRVAGAEAGKTKYMPNQIKITPVERNRVLDCFKITLNAPDAKTAISYTNAFASYCNRAYTEERSSSLQKWKEDLMQKKSDIFNDIRRLDNEKSKLGAPIDIVAPEKDYEQLRQLLTDQRSANTKLGLTVASLEHRRSRLKKKLDQYNPGLLENEKVLREMFKAMKQLDEEVMIAEGLYTDLNPKLMALRARREQQEKRFQAFLKEKKLDNADEESLEAATAINTELKEVDTDLESRREEMRILTRELNDTTEKFDHLNEILPNIQKINQQYASLQDSLHKLDTSVSDINYLLPLVKDDLLIGERADTAYGIIPFSKRNIAICIFAALSLTGFMAVLTVLLEFWLGTVSSEKELSLLPGLPYLGSLPTSDELFESKRKQQIAFNTICHNFQASETEYHIVLTGTLPGGKLIPSLFDAFEWTFAMAGKKTLAVDMVLADNFDDTAFQECDTGIIVYSGSKGYLPVGSKHFLAPSEQMLLKQDLQLLRETYDLIFIKHSASLRRDRMFLEQIVGLCDSAMIAVGARKTTRKYLRRLVAIHKKTNLPIMTILSDNSRDAAEKSTNLEVGI
jgi:hypothetical protein